MTPRLSELIGRRARARWATLLSMLFVTLGALPALTAMQSAAACETACPCEAEASTPEALAAPVIVQTACMDDCGQCTCCVGVFATLVPNLGLWRPIHPRRVAADPPQNDPSRGVCARIYRPPQPLA